MLSPSSSLAFSSDQLSEEEAAEPQVKPVRKRAKKKPRLGFCKGMIVAIEPTEEQASLLARWTGATRWAWNQGLAQQHDHYAARGKHLSINVLSRALTDLKKTDELAWLNEVPRTCLTQNYNHLAAAWKNFFEGISGKRFGKAPGKPVFRRKGGDSESLTFQIDPRHTRCVDETRRVLRIPGIGEVSARFSQAVPGNIASVTVYRKSGRWQASLALVDVPSEAMVSNTEKVKQFALCEAHGYGFEVNCAACSDYQRGLAGLDASVPHGLVGSSNGETTYPLADAAFRAAQDAKLDRGKAYRRRASNQLRHRLREAGLDPSKPISKGTRLPKSNRQRKNETLGRKWELKALFSRNDLIHKFTTELVRNHHTIVVETLVLSYMAKSLNRGFRRRFHEAAMGEILRQLEYKCGWYGRTLIKVDKWFPSSKRCSNPECHQKNTELKLKDRAWNCRFCETHHERDDNAAFNLWQEGWRLLQAQQQSASCPTVGSTAAARLGLEEKPASPGVLQSNRSSKRESSFHLSSTNSGKEPGLVGVG